MRDGYLAGAFDLFNVGDLDVIRQARELCERLVVGVFSDAYVTQSSGRPPIVALEERVALLQHVRGVDEVFVHDDVDLGEVEEAASVFVVTSAGAGPEFDHLGNVTWLTQRRQTQSAGLRRALEPLAEGAVA